VLFNALAKASLGRKDAEGAEEYLTKARAADPAFLQTYYNMATFMLAKGKPDEAVAQYDLALGVAPGDVRALTASAPCSTSRARPTRPGPVWKRPAPPETWARP
jgi:tetratricopeptide (TPR) repeat protein